MCRTHFSAQINSKFFKEIFQYEDLVLSWNVFQQILTLSFSNYQLHNKNFFQDLLIVSLASIALLAKENIKKQPGRGKRKGDTGQKQCSWPHSHLYILAGYRPWSSLPSPAHAYSHTKFIWKKGSGTWTFLEAETQVPRFLWLPLYARQAS